MDGSGFSQAIVKMSKKEFVTEKPANPAFRQNRAKTPDWLAGFRSRHAPLPLH
jgi:hypothetical protein